MRLKGKIAIVTGAASGFGEGIARLYAQEGAKVVVADLNLAGAERVAGEIGASAVALLTSIRPWTKRHAPRVCGWSSTILGIF